MKIHILNISSIFISIMLLVGCGEPGSTKWRLDNESLSADEIAQLKTSIAFKDEFFKNGAKWNTLSTKDWAKFLSFFPEYSRECDKLNGWGRFTGSDWAILLSEESRFENQCEKNSGWSKMSPEDWIYLLSKQPKYEVKADESKSWNKFSTEDWVKALLSNGEFFIKKCDALNIWKKLKVADWFSLIKKNKNYQSLLDKCIKFDTLSKNDWESLIKLDKKFIDVCKKNNALKFFDVKDLLNLIDKDNIELLSNEIDWNSFDTTKGNDYRIRENKEFLVKIIKEKSYIIEKCPDNVIKSMSNYEWIELLGANINLSKFADKYNIWKSFNFSDWNNLLKKNKDYTDTFIKYEQWKEWEKYSARSLWNTIAEGNPALSHLKELHTRSVAEWIKILSTNPSEFENFEKYADVNSLRSSDWSSILISNPALAEYAKKYNIFETKLWGEDIVKVVIKYPELANLLRNKKVLGKLDEPKWKKLVLAVPSLIPLYEKTKRFDEKWIQCLISDYDKEIEDFLAFEAYKGYAGSGIIARKWEYLLKNQPRFVENYENKEIIYVLRHHPHVEVNGIGAILFKMIRDDKNQKAFFMLKAIATPIEGERIGEIYEHESNMGYIYYYLARCYKDGLCVERDENKAKAYYLLMKNAGGDAKSVNLDANGKNEEFEKYYEKVGNDI